MTTLLLFLALELLRASLVEPNHVLVPAVHAVAPAADKPEMEYTYVEANYLWTDSDDLDESLDGWELIGSLELPLNFFAQVQVSQQSDRADLEAWRIGGGYHLPLGSSLDAYGILSVAHTEVDGSDDDFDDEGIAGEVGLRMLLSPKIEVNGSAEWLDVDDDDFTIGVGARYYFTNFLSIGGRVESVDADPSFAVGLRFEI